MLTVEDRLLLLLARWTFTGEMQDRARRLLAEAPAWPKLLDTARTHGVVPLLCRNLERLGLDAPPPVLEDLRAAYRRIAVHNTLLAHELTQVLSALRVAGIPAIPVKGVALAASLYRDLTARVCSDLDVLVPRAQAKPALEVLSKAGYRATTGGDGRGRDLLLRHDIEYPLRRSSRGIEYAVDLHWGIAWGGSADERATRELWTAARDAWFQGVRTLALSPEWEVLFLALHAARHQWRGLKWLVDIHELCVRGGMEWGCVRETAARFGWTEPLRVTLVACRTLLETPVPDVLSRGALPPGVRPLSGDPARPGEWHDPLLPARVFSRLSEKVRYLLRLLLVPTMAELRLVRLPPRLALLYYPLRPARLSVKWGGALMRAAWKGSWPGAQGGLIESKRREIA
jgi:hypothetical protein